MVRLLNRIGGRVRRTVTGALSQVDNLALDGAGPASAEVESTVEVITTLDQVDEKLAEIDAAWSVSDDAVRAVFASFRLEIDPVHGSDPWSEAYRAAQFELYQRISARPHYTTGNEVSGFPVDPKCPFPYYTKSAATVGDQLIAIGYIIKTMALPPGSSILEFGPGWGNTTISLSRMGYEVTALDIDSNFVQLIHDRARPLGLKPDARLGEFLDAGTIDGQFDAVLFYECFHHCSDHVRLLRDLHRLVKPGGHVFLAAEPILEAFHAPWGLRLDGESLWAIRQNGWLELGFTESYFIETCMRQGWTVSKHASDISHLTSIFSLTSVDETVSPGLIRFPPYDESGWAVPDSPSSEQRYSLTDSRLVCPVDRQYDKIVVSLTNPAPHDIAFTVRHGCSVESGRISKQSQRAVALPYDAVAGEVRIGADTWRPSDSIHRSQDGRLIGVAVTGVQFR